MSGYDYSDRRVRAARCPSCGAESVILLRSEVLYCHPHYRSQDGCANPHAAMMKLCDITQDEAVEMHSIA